MVSMLVEITHLLFMDDTILFNSSRQEEFFVMKKTLRCFELCSRLKINLAKSMLVGVGCPEELIYSLASKLSCKAGQLPILYLAWPTSGSPSLNAFWDPVVERFERKLSAWKKSSLSMGDRIMLIKATLFNLSGY